MFGEFYCEDCDNKWYSGNAWKGKGQQCNQCEKMIQPTSLKPLRRPGYLAPKKPHQQDLCQKCQELGYNCQNYRPEEEEEEEEEDDIPDEESVFSAYSTSTDSSATARSDDDVTPVPSDSEIADDLLDQLEEVDLRD